MVAHVGRTRQNRGQGTSHPVSGRRSRPPSPWARGMVQWRRILPALPEGEVKIGDCGTANLQLNVVPGRTRSVSTVELYHLRVSSMHVVVTTTVAQVCLL